MPFAPPNFMLTWRIMAAEAYMAVRSRRYRENGARWRAYLEKDAGCVLRRGSEPRATFAAALAAAFAAALAAACQLRGTDSYLGQSNGDRWGLGSRARGPPPTLLMPAIACCAHLRPLNTLRNDAVLARGCPSLQCWVHPYTVDGFTFREDDQHEVQVAFAVLGKLIEMLFELVAALCT
eukprot:scaffold141906_cov31-Tisochrysis_lutea.AAC.3